MSITDVTAHNGKANAVPLPIQVADLEARIATMRSHVVALNAQIRAEEAATRLDWLDQVDPHRDAKGRHARHVGHNIRARRKHADLSQVRLGLRIDTSHVNVSAWENGHHTPDARNLERLAAALHCHWTDFFSRNGDEP